MAYTQQNRLLSMSTPLGKDAFILTRFIGTEGISTDSTFKLTALSEQVSVDPTLLIGQSVNFDIELLDGSYRVFNGLIDSVEYKGIVNKDYRRYVFTIVSHLSFLKKKTDNRIFQKQSLMDTVKSILDEHKVKYRAQLIGTYIPEDYCVQYGESDFDFVHRLLQEAGVNYHIEHKIGEHTLVLFDHFSAYQKSQEAEHVYRDGDSGKAHYFNWCKETRLLSGRHAQRSYDFLTPDTPIASKSDTVVPLEKSKEFEQYRYPALNNLGLLADLESERQMETVENKYIELNVSSYCRTLAPAQTFAFTEHFLDSEIGNPYLATQIKYIARDDTYLNQPGATQVMGCKVTAIPAGLTYRKDKEYKRPTIDGTQTAIVTGPRGEEIFTDEAGRIKVQFHWDRLGKRDENSSCWIRVAQNWASGGWGGQHIPRIGQEVIISYENGDINKPLVTGTVYNGKNKPAYGLPANKTQSGLKSHSTKGADPSLFNEVKLEDKKGAEELYIQAQKDQTTMIKRNHSRAVGHDQTLSVGGNKSEVIKKNRHSIVNKGGESLQVEGDIAMQSVTGGIVFEAKQRIELRTSGAKIVLNADGHIVIVGNIVDMDGSGKMNINMGSNPHGKRLSPTKVDGVYQTPSVGGGYVKAFHASSLASNIGPATQHHLSRATNASEANAGVSGSHAEPEPIFEPELHTVDLNYQRKNKELLKAVPFKVTDASGAIQTGVLDDSGQAHLGGLQPGPVNVEYYPDESEEKLVALRQQLKTALDDIITKEKADAQMYQREQDKMGLIHNYIVHTGSRIDGAWNALKGSVGYVKELADVVTPYGQLRNALRAQWQSYRTNFADGLTTGSISGFYNDYQEQFKEFNKEELIDVIGFDPTEITTDDFVKAYEATVYVSKDADTRNMLLKFGAQYATVQDSVEYSNASGAVLFEVLLTLTGVGAAKHLKHTKTAGSTVEEIVELQKKLELKSNDSGSSNGKVDTEADVAEDVEIGGAAFKDGIYQHSLKPKTNKELYGKAITRTPEEAKEILAKLGHDPEMLEQYNFRVLDDDVYEKMVNDLGGQHFDASYGNVAPGTSSVSFDNNIAGTLITGEQKIPVYVKQDVFDSDEALAQVLSHEIYEIEELRYAAKAPISTNEYWDMVRPDRADNLHYEAVQEGDEMLEVFRGLSK